MNGGPWVALAGMLLLGGCAVAPSADRDATPSKEPGLAWHECPAEVAISLTTRHRCGTLTVPLDHGRPAGATLDLEVVQVWPSDGTAGDGVLLSAGFNFGEPMQGPSDMLALADRTDVPVLALAPRGAHGGGPLDCPEAVAPGAAGGSTAEAFADAVAACRDRLAGSGVDVARYGVGDIAEDLEALRTAMGVERWYAMVSYGELSRVSDAYAAAYGEHVRAVVQDSPAPAGRDSFALAGEGLRSAVDSLLEECADDPVCAGRYPDLPAQWEHALARLSDEPLTVRGADGDVRVDAPVFLRAVRSLLGNGSAADLPRVVTAAGAGQVHPALTAVLAHDAGHCLGHRPVCSHPDFTLGAYLSQACPELGTTPVAGTGARFREAFDGSPYAAACAAWDVEASAPPPAPGVPTLVLTGDLDPWSRPEWHDDAVRVRGATHDVASTSTCVFEVRNPWIADPGSPPDASPCDTEPFPDWD